MPALGTAAPFHEVRIHPRTGAIVPLNIGWLSPLTSTDDDWYDPEELVVASQANFDGKYGVRLAGVPRNGSVVVLDMTNPSDPVQMTQVNATPGVGQFWVAEQSASADYGQVNVGFGFIEVHSSLNGITLEVHYQSIGSVLSATVIDDKISTEVTSQIDAASTSLGNYAFEFANGADTDHDVTITIYSPSGATSSITKQMDATWVEGTNAGGMESGQIMPTSAVVKWIVITKDSDPTVIDFIGTPRTTLSALVVPAGWSKKCAFDVFRMVTDSSANFPLFQHSIFAGVVLLRGTLALDLSVADQGTTRTTRQAINVPDRVMALRRSHSSCGSTHIVKVEALIHTDQAPTISGAALYDHRGDSAVASNALGAGQGVVYVDASRQYATDSTAASTSLYVQFYGWLWRPV